MSRTYRSGGKKDISWSSPKDLQEKRPKQKLQAEIDEEMKRIRSPLYRWERERE